ncbi:hypothetical protein PAHAL_5G325600 [Panicum hallii]|uniref:Hydrophobic seed protein domain-containing protein n=1 Tax=Panicum hallii TaxID=206008 RepID=A0A2S3HV93_9POAL|nr:hypothetical protein PAHAL_5G325600 [Panicum hallii]
MAKNSPAFVQLLLVLVTLLVFVGGILARGGRSTCANNPTRQEACPSIPGKGQ